VQGKIIITNITLRNGLETRDAIFEVINNSLHLAISPNATNVLHIRLRIILPFIIRALRELNTSNVKFIINLCDESDLENKYDIPYICLTKDVRSNHKLIPNIDFFSGLMLRLLRESRNDIDYKSKTNGSCFVGSSTNGIKRIRYCHEMLDDPIHFAKISNLCQINKSEIVSSFPRIDECLTHYMSVKDQLKYKILVNIDGNSVCWSRLYWQLNSNSIPVYVEKHKYFTQYFDQIMPEDCYFKCDFENYKNTFDYILNPSNSNHVNMINENGKNFCKKAFNQYLSAPQDFLVNIIKEVITEIKNENM
jgi:hypothetical protein